MLAAFWPDEIAMRAGEYQQAVALDRPQACAKQGLREMGKTGNEKFGEHLVSDVVRAIQQTDRAVHAVLEHHHLSRWHPVSTAPYNQDLELRVSEDGAITTIPFPCRHTNEDEWINVDLGVPLHIQPVEWRAWQQSKSPHPHLTSIFSPETRAGRRLEQRGQLRGHPDEVPGSFSAKPQK